MTTQWANINGKWKMVESEKPLQDEAKKQQVKDFYYARMQPKDEEPKEDSLLKALRESIKKQQKEHPGEGSPKEPVRGKFHTCVECQAVVPESVMDKIDEGAWLCRACQSKEFEAQKKLERKPPKTFAEVYRRRSN